MKKSRRKKLGGIFAICAAVILAGLAIARIVTGIDISSGLSRQMGSFAYYASKEAGAALALQRSGNDVWGFFEWPQEKLYGFFDSKAGENGRINADLRSPSGWNLSITIPKKPGALKAELRLVGKKNLTMELSLENRNLRYFSVESYAGMIDAIGHKISPLHTLLQPLSIEDGSSDFNRSFFHVDAVGGKTASQRELLNNKLRRGIGILEYAREQWARFGEYRLAAIGAGNQSRVFVERQYLVPAFSGFYTLATERYVFDGGAHGNTTVVMEIIDSSSGGSLQAKDIFMDGWEIIVAEKLRAEALRLFADAQAGKAGKLSDHNFFEESVRPSSSIFLCNSGIGFHYDRYELAPYSEGDFTFVLSWNELDGLLKIPAMRERAEQS